MTPKNASDLTDKEAVIKALYPVAQKFISLARSVKTLSPDVLELPSHREFMSFKHRTLREFDEYVMLNPGVLAGITIGIPTSDRVDATIVTAHIASIYLNSTEHLSQMLSDRISDPAWTSLNVN
jgi:hypothetical protein